MRTRSLRRLGPVAALALTTLAALAACTSTSTPSTRPAAAPPAVANPAPAAAPHAEPVRVVAPRTTRPAPRPATDPACLGAVVHRLDAADTGPPWRPLCLAVGGVVRVANLGPEGFSTDAGDKVECDYAAGTRECRLLHAGTVRFTITTAERTRTQVVRITKASSKPSPACLPAGTTFTIDASDGGPHGWAACMKMSGTVRVENLGPEGFQVSPAGAVSCFYEAAVRTCRFTRAETVTFTTTHGDQEPRTQTVVAIR